MSDKPMSAEERAEEHIQEVNKHTNQQVCACESCVDDWGTTIRAAERAAVAVERERCARLVDDYNYFEGSRPRRPRDKQASEVWTKPIASAIRAGEE